MKMTKQIAILVALTMFVQIPLVNIAFAETESPQSSLGTVSKQLTSKTASEKEIKTKAENSKIKFEKTIKREENSKTFWNSSTFVESK